jgi:nucleotide-binding universal stress UspA family protein
LGLSDSEGTARKTLPGLDRRSLGKGAGARILDPPRPLFGGFERSQPPHRVAGRRDGRGLDAKLTFVNITASVELYGPGGSNVDPVWKETIVGFAANEIAKLQQYVGTKAEVIIDSGNVPELLNRAAEQTKADVLVIGYSPLRGHLGDNGNGYGIIRELQLPVLSV